MRYPTTRDAGPVLPWTVALLYHRTVGPTVRRPHHPCRRPRDDELISVYLRINTMQILLIKLTLNWSRIVSHINYKTSATEPG